MIPPAAEPSTATLHSRFRGAWPPGLFTLAYWSAAAVAAVATGNSEFVFYVVVLALLVGAVGVAHWRVSFSTGLLWALAGWGALHMAGGLIPVPESWPIQGQTRVLYSWWIIPIEGGQGPGVGEGGWLKFDHLVHLYGFGVTAWACWQGLCGAVGERQPTLGLMLLVAAAAMGFGALNEVVEFAATLMGPTNVGGYINTGWDLVANSLGAVIAVVLIWSHGRRVSTR